MEDRDGDRIALMRAFVECARRLNFKASAGALGLTPSTLGRRVARLEKRLGVALFLRSTRRVALTEAGAIYLPLCEDLLSALDEADATASSLGGRPTGLLRVAAPTTFSRMHLTGALPKFLAEHPDIRLDIAYSDAYIDVVEERIDVAIRIGRLADTSLRARFLAPNVRRLVAAPSYLADAPPLRTPDDLSDHRLLHFSHLKGGDAWLLECDGAERRVPVAPWLRSDDAFVLYEAAIAGLGVALLADFISADGVRSGELTPVLTEWRVPETGVYALYAGAAIPPKTRAFIDFLVDIMSPSAPWCLEETTTG
ncbi:MAG: LysR family transcriptional regulator [Pseudomonadota bacterium]